METPYGLRIAHLALRRGLVGPEDLREALAQQARDAASGKTPRELSVLLLARGRLGERDFHRLLGDAARRAPAVDASTLFCLGRFRLVRTLGAGRTGRVLEAVDTADGRSVALKLPGAGAASDPGRERFVREARLAAAIPPHPNVVAVRGAGEIDGQAYLAMELVRGTGLDRWRSAGGPLRAQVAVLRGVASGVDHAHRHGVLHRDLKPANVIVDESGTARVLDFGFARSLDARIASPTESGQVIGTPIYMSPEQARGERDLDGRSDVYSLGAMLYEMLAGRPPVDGRNAVEVLLKAVREPLRPPSRAAGRPVDPMLEAICVKALAKDRRRRHPSARAFADELGSWLAGERRAGRSTRLWWLLPPAAALLLWAGYRLSARDATPAPANARAAAESAVGD